MTFLSEATNNGKGMRQSGLFLPGRTGKGILFRLLPESPRNTKGEL